MSTKEVTRRESFPALFDEFFKPWNEWFGTGKSLTTPAVNVSENKNHYEVSVAAPGLKKNDFNIDLEGNTLTISCEKEENKEDNDARFTRREYSYTSFRRSFTLPEEVVKDKIEAAYEDGVLRIILPKTEESKKATLSKHITVK